MAAEEKSRTSFADILKISKKGLSGSVHNRLTTVKGRLPNTISTGSLFLDYNLNGGFLNGNFYHLYGPSGGGKSTIFYRTCAANQRVDKALLPMGMGSLPNYLPNGDYADLDWRNIIICDAEGSVNELFLSGCGVQYEENPNFTIFTPDTGEDWFTFHKRICMAWRAEHLDKKEQLSADYIPILSGIDSLAALIPASLLEDEQKQIAYLARLLSDYLPLTQATNMKTGGVTIGINQVRENPMAGPYGNPETTKGGQAPYFTAAMNVRVSRTGKNEELVGDEIGTAYNLKLGIKKCRYAKSFIDYELQSIMGRGFSRMSDMWNYAVASGQIVGGAAGWYQLNVIGRPDLGITKNARGEDVKNYMRENNLYEIFVKQVFSGSAWGHALEPWQLEMIGNVDIKGTPVDIIDPKVEEELSALAAKVRAEGERETIAGLQVGNNL
jgi:RecA/RadA recombinase